MIKHLLNIQPSYSFKCKDAMLKKIVDIAIFAPHLLMRKTEVKDC